MKTAKKLIVVALTLIMALSMAVTTLAAIPGNETIGGEGDTVYINTEIFEAILPTTGAWDFTLDPMGLAGANATFSNLEETAGLIIPGSFTPVAVNLSSVPLTLNVEVKVTGDANVITTNRAAVDEGTGTNILLNVVASTAMVNDPATDDPFAGTNATPISKEGKILKFVLENAAYEYGKDGDNFTYTRVAADLGHGTRLQISGFVNKDANWTDFTLPAANPLSKSVGISATFSFAKATTEDIALAAATPAAYGFKGATDAILPLGFLNAEKVSATDGGTVDAIVATLKVIPFNFDGKTPSGFTVNGNTFVPTAPTHVFDVVNNEIRFGGFPTALERAFSFVVDGTTYTLILNVEED